MTRGNKPLSVIVADRSKIMQRGVIGVLREAWPEWSYHSASNADEMTALITIKGADLLMVDLGLPGLHGAGAIRQLRALDPGCAMVALGENENRAALQECVTAGLTDYVPRSATAAQLRRIIQSVLTHDLFSPTMSVGDSNCCPTAVPDPDKEGVGGGIQVCLTRFSGRQSDVFRLLAQGYTTNAIGTRLNLSPGTVKVHLAAIYRQLNVHSRLQAVACIRTPEISVPPSAAF